MSTTVRLPQISPTTEIWVANSYWSLYSQCCTWHPKGGVDIWECIRPHNSTPTTAPPNPDFWRYLCRR